MTLWLILTIMTSFAAVCVAVPLIRRLDRPQRDSTGDIEVYRDQLQELERDLHGGLIDASQAEPARLEIQRRILAVDAAPPVPPQALSGAARSFAIVGMTAIVVLGSTLLYAVTGSPDLAQTRRTPGGERSAVMPRGASELPPNHPSLEGFVAADWTAEGEGERQPGLPTVEEMIRRLAERLAQNPDDTEGWRTLGWSYLNIGRFAEAAEAYGKAIEHDPGNTEFMGGRIEALVGAANGGVTPEARAIIGEVLKRDPKDARARYFAGLASEQDGDKAAALARWTALLEEGGADASWESELKSRIAALKQDRRGAGGAAAAAPKLEAATGSSSQPVALAMPLTSAERGPRPQDIQAAAAMSPGDRSAMIRGMVDGLTNRLERSPRDVDGWIKLIRSRVVLGEIGLAKEALVHGLATFAGDGPERDRIAAAARELGVGP